MRNFSRTVLSQCAAIVIFAGCGGSQKSLVIPESPAATPGSHRLWSAGDIGKNRRLLFVSNYDYALVDMYSLPDLALVGEVALSSDLTLQGECADKSGDVWVTAYTMTSYGTNELVELSHDGSVLGKTTFYYGNPQSCAIDPKTGNLAVTEVPFSGSGGGGVVIYTGGSGSGRLIDNPRQYWYTWDGYDNQGNLWVDGLDRNDHVVISRCGTTSCTTVPTSGATLHRPGFVQYVASQHTWYVGNDCAKKPEQADFCIDPVSPSGFVGTPITFTGPDGRRIGMEQALITGGQTRVVIGTAHRNKRSWVARWNFSGGGSWITETLTGDYGWGAAISAPVATR